MSRRNLLVAAMLAGVVVLTGVVALAGEEQAKIEATEFTADDGEAGVGYARCHGSKRAVGGGVVQSGSADGLQVQASGPLDFDGSSANTIDGDVAIQWYASVLNDSGEDGRVFKVFAICARGSNATIKTTEFTVDNQDTGEAFARCGGRKRALGGGVIQDDSNGSAVNIRVQASGPLNSSGAVLDTSDGDVAKQWYAAIFNDTAEDDRVFKVFAICARGSDAKIEATEFTVDNGETGEAFARCGGSKRALGGGVVPSGGTAALYVRASGPLDSSGATLNTEDGDVAKQWYAAVDNESGQDDRVFKVFAICV